jgi:hypothetical protein
MKPPSNALYWGTAAANCFLAVLAFGFVGLVITFWVMLFWYSIWKTPKRFEMLFLSFVGLVGAILFLPANFWPSVNKFFLVGFVFAALIPFLRLRAQSPHSSE